MIDPEMSTAWLQSTISFWKSLYVLFAFPLLVVTQGPAAQTDMILMQLDGSFWIIAILQGLFTIVGLMVTKSEESAPSRHALTILAVVTSELLKNGLHLPSKLIS